MNFGIIGAGAIAHTMATTITQMNEASMYAIASRSMERALAYKEQYHMEKAYASYEELAKDPNVDVIYIATPHAFHYEQAKMCLEHRKHILLEKAFTVNEMQAKELTYIAESKGLFLGEAMWTRFMPLAKKLKELITGRVIGDPMFVTANLNFPMMHKDRLIKAELAGGALLDVGIYPLTIASIVMGDDIEKINATAILSKEGVDKVGQYTLLYNDGRIADLNAGMCFESDGNALIYGSHGSIEVEGVNFIRALNIYNAKHQLINHISYDDIEKYPYRNGEQITGYEYEVLACINAIKSGKTECPEMTHEQTLTMMRLMDSIRKEIGVRYPFE